MFQHDFGFRDNKAMAKHKEAYGNSPKAEKRDNYQHRNNFWRQWRLLFRAAITFRSIPPTARTASEVNNGMHKTVILLVSAIVQQQITLFRRRATHDGARVQVERDRRVPNRDVLASVSCHHCIWLPSDVIGAREGRHCQVESRHAIERIAVVSKVQSLHTLSTLAQEDITIVNITGRINEVPADP